MGIDVPTTTARTDDGVLFCVELGEPVLDSVLEHDAATPQDAKMPKYA
jgi:hypothetical protein